MYRILFVDDEKAILRSLKRLFYGLGWQLYFAEDGREALGILSEHRIDMVISDMRMPNMDGHTLLKEVQRLYPHTIRLILSGFSDEKEIYQAVLDGSAKSYFLKPWEPKQLIDFLKHLFDLRDVLESKNILQYIENIRSIPTFNCVINEINQLIEKDAGTSEIAKIIEWDPGISARVLQLVNSSSYNNNVCSVKQAVYQIGNFVLKNIINDREYTHAIEVNSEIGLKYKFIGRHAAVTNMIMELTYQQFLGKRTPDVAVAASALHNVGSFLSEETEMPHEEIGGYILNWWGMPDQIVESAFYHHNPLSASEENQELIGVIHLANYYACSFLNVKVGQLEERIFEILNINQEHYEEIIRATFAEYEFKQCYLK